MATGEFWDGWVIFAAVIFVLMGIFHIIQGITALVRDTYFVVGEEQLLVFDFTTWGILMLIWGVLLMVAGFSLAGMSRWARWFAVVMAGISAISQYGFLVSFPFLSLLIIALDVIVIFALTARWGQIKEYRRRSGGDRRGRTRRRHRVRPRRIARFSTVTARRTVAARNA